MGPLEDAAQRIRDQRAEEEARYEINKALEDAAARRAAETAARNEKMRRLRRTNR